ncbi:hypothetical protein F5890DRAFT_1547403 [Lentinula detonsa]|uniref:Uncharacterized protein n=1 Tax=Lentinula detonsa TaxID=2804962 RepID=A0AA38PNY2_9AGAR|nr:hypothetical protein F5890DRAFT_1547403 [Lentinula detonsa]
MVILSLSASQLLSVVFSILLSMKVMGRPLLTTQLERRHPSIMLSIQRGSPTSCRHPDWPTEIWTIYIGLQNGFRAQANYDTNPEDNPNWPWVVEKVPQNLRTHSPQAVNVDLQNRHTSSGGTLDPAAVKKQLFDDVVSKLAFQGHFHFISEAVHFMYEQQYIQNLPQDFDEQIRPFLVQEKTDWASKYIAQVRQIYDDEVYTDRVRWELHRLLVNNCEEYRHDLRPDLPIPTLDFLINYSRTWCV